MRRDIPPEDLYHRLEVMERQIEKINSYLEVTNRIRQQIRSQLLTTTPSQVWQNIALVFKTPDPLKRISLQSLSSLSDRPVPFPPGVIEAMVGETALILASHSPEGVSISTLEKGEVWEIELSAAIPTAKTPVERELLTYLQLFTQVLQDKRGSIQFHSDTSPQRVVRLEFPISP